MNILSGEPVPPGFEDEVNRVAEIQKAIAQYKGNALIGLEYTLELYEDDRKEPAYLCLLCDKRGDPRTIMQHWTSFNHRHKYLEKHYPTAVREFNPVKYKPNSHNIMISIVQSLSEAIEDHHGRLTLSVYNADEFRQQKTKITNEINGKFHYDERNGPNFVHVIDRSLLGESTQITIKAPKRLNNEINEINEGTSSKRQDLDEISSDSDGADISKPSKKTEQNAAYRVLPRVRRSPPFEEERPEKDSNEKKLPTPKELSMQASHIAQERYKWEKYRCMLEIQLKQMEKQQQDFEKNPEKHPMYPEEWKKFWNRRYKELQAEKKVDPNKYDYKPEWIVFWTKRMKDMFNDEVDKKKKEIKIKLGLPENAEEKVDQLKERYKVQISRPESTTSKAASSNSRNNRASNDVIDISDDDSPHRRRNRSRTPSRRRSPRSISPAARRDYGKRVRRSRSKSPIDFERNSYHRSRNPLPIPSRYETEYYARSRYPPDPVAGSYGAPHPSHHYRILESHKYPKYEESLSPHPPAFKKVEEPEPEDDGPLTVVAVLRLLTALEDHLGSLGPKVVDLLGKALALEKVKANSSDDMLMNDDYCVFFETIKEKLKGLLIADVLEDQQKVRAVKKAIKNIAAIVHQITTKGFKDVEEAEKSIETSKTTGDNSKSNGIKKKTGKPTVQELPFDRQVLATKLAAALVMEGREDVSTEDMDKLIFLFVLMVKMSKSRQQTEEINESLHTRDILPELGIEIPPAAPALANKFSVLPAIVDEFLESEVSALVQEVEDDISNDTNEKESKNDSGGSSMLESLTDSDLQTLLQNFKHLSTEEQHHLIAHLKKLETADPTRVEKLRKFVNFSDLDLNGGGSASSSNKTSKQNTSAGISRQRQSRFNESPSTSNKVRSKYVDGNEGEKRKVNPNKFSLDDEDEDDDYNFEDVFRAASSNVNRLSEEHSRQTQAENSTPKNKEPIVPVSSSPSALTFNAAGLNSISLSDTQNLIANLMGSLQQSNANKASTSSGNHAITPQVTVPPHPVPPADNSQHAGMPSQPYYQQQQQQSQDYGSGPYGNQAYYNNMGGPGPYNNAGAPPNFVSYPQWGNGQGSYGMQNYMQPQQQPPSMGYNNMYGRGGQ